MKSALFNGVEVRRRLYLRGMRGQQLAAAVGVSEASISSYLTGKRRPSPPVFLRICRALDAQPDELCSAPPDPPATSGSVA
ncbi:helix-turn-helix domain-containing protein [Streptomyces sp. NPDC088789]|uniref:helix-turn-helix domain-containing protein n=1 Tax=Streptomyces sp. NPDC088789 TaxID=3365899 RepID=UPI003825EAEB